MQANEMLTIVMGMATAKSARRTVRHLSRTLKNLVSSSVVSLNVYIADAAPLSNVPPGHWIDNELQPACLYYSDIRQNKTLTESP